MHLGYNFHPIYLSTISNLRIQMMINKYIREALTIEEPTDDTLLGGLRATNYPFLWHSELIKVDTVVEIIVGIAMKSGEPPATTALRLSC